MRLEHLLSGETRFLDAARPKRKRRSSKKKEHLLFGETSKGTHKSSHIRRISPIRLVRLMSPTKSRDVKQMVCFASPALLGALSFKIEKQ